MNANKIVLNSNQPCYTAHKSKKMNKEQFLAMSLPFNTTVCVKYTHKPDGSEYEDLVGLLDGRVITNETEEDDPLLPISDYRILLRPLSDLTKEIEHKGERFVPIERIKESQHHLFFRTDIENPIDGLQFSEVMKLIKWHFDICGLIEKGYAIDVNMLDINPYK